VPIGVGGVVFECVETHAPAGATLLLYADGLVALLEPTEDVLRFEVGDDSPQVPRTPDSADRTRPGRPSCPMKLTKVLFCSIEHKQDHSVKGSHPAGEEC
jgi:hypothetical protein